MLRHKGVMLKNFWDMAPQKYSTCHPWQDMTICRVVLYAYNILGMASCAQEVGI